MRREAARALIEFERVPAIDSRSLTPEQLGQCSEEMYDGARRRLVPGDVACFLSHQRLWQQLATQPDPYTAIFEDDIRIGEGLAELLANPSWIPADADLVKIETTLRPTTIDKTASGTAGTRRVHRLRGWHAGTAGYIATPRGAAQLAAHSKIIRSPVDLYIYGTTPDSPELVIYQLVPGICVQAQYDENADPTLVSLVAGSRKEAQPKRSAVAKIAREIYRPLERLGRSTTRIVSNAFGATVTNPVPFD